jgi:hypothetical protein
MSYLIRFVVAYPPNAVQAIAVGMLQQAFLDLSKEGVRYDPYKWEAYDFLASGNWCELICDAAQVEYDVVQARFKEVIQDGNAGFLSRPSKKRMRLQGECKKSFEKND